MHMQIAFVPASAGKRHGQTSRTESAQSERSADKPTPSRNRRHIFLLTDAYDHPSFRKCIKSAAKSASDKKQLFFQFVWRVCGVCEGVWNKLRKLLTLAFSPQFPIAPAK
jgi:hypothetical protein